MYILIIVVFVIGYVCIALEHTLKIDKAASAIITGVLCWVILMYGKDSMLETIPDIKYIDDAIVMHLGEIGEILFFLLAAMTIVELIDSHDGFDIITSKIKTTDRIKLLWIISIVSFFLSAVLDNLTATIVLAALLKKLVSGKEDLWFFGGMVVIAANAGGAWSPIGDVTTIMLWIGGQITALNIITKLILPSTACLLVPLIILSFNKKRQITHPSNYEDNRKLQSKASDSESALILWLGVSALLFVPVFKSLTHLPPFMGILFSMAVLWVVTGLIHKKKPEEHRYGLMVSHVIQRIDTPSVLFFLGILLSVASLQTAGHLGQLATTLESTFGDIYLINILIGLLSAVVDNVPLVAGAMGMYPLSVYPQDAEFWNLLAYCAGTGGSALIIGSAAGVAIMGILKIDFIWYLKKISWLALIGYFSGVFVYFLLN